MKLIGKYESEYFDRSGNIVISFKVDNPMYFAQIEGIEKDNPLSIEVKKIKSNRTLEQNRYMWALLREISVKIGNESDEWFYYILALEKTGSKHEYIVCLEEAEEDLKRAFRAVKYVKPFDEEKKTAVYKCFYGSSKMNTKEMGLLIDTILDMAAEAGVGTEYWAEVLR